MAGDIRVFELGLGGVNLVKSPLELSDNELVSAQNAEPFREQGVAGIRKRPGLQRVVPTGTVTPTAAAAGLSGLAVINANLAGPFASANIPTYLGYSTTTGLYTVDGGTTWANFTSPTGSTPPSETKPLLGLQPNAKYFLTASGAYEFLSLYPAVRVWNWVVFGGHESGQLLGFDGTKVVELTRLSATGSLDDTLPLPGLWANDIKPFTIQGFGGTDSGITAQLWVVVAIVGGGVQLYDVITGTVKKLPTLGSTATGSAFFNGRLYVAAGLSIYSIDPVNETAWTTAVTVVDANISQLTSLAPFGATLYAGTKCGGLGFLRIYKFVSTSGGFLTLVRSAGNDSLMISQSASPTYLFGPFASVNGGIYCIYKGVNGATLAGSEGAGTTTGTRNILRMANGSTTWVIDYDITNTAFGGASNITMGPLYRGSQGIYFYGRYNSTDLRVLRSSVYNTSPYVWDILTTQIATGVEPIYPLFSG